MDIKRRFRREIEEINSALERFLADGGPRNLYSAARYLPLAGGKRLRPLLTLLSAEAVGGEGSKALPFGLALEIVHNFTLVHDDIMDKSRLRRGLEAVHIRFGEPTAILAGDLLFAKAFEILQEVDTDPLTFKELNRLIIGCVERICEGQQLDMDFEGQKMVTEKEYMDMIEKKTASLFSCATKGGAIIGGGSKEEIDALAAYGRFFGLSFQIWDDYLDLCGKQQEIGKVIGNDIRDGKKTLIVTHALEHTQGEQKKTLLSVLGKKDVSDEEIQRVVKVLTDSGSIEYAKEKACGYVDQAKHELNTLKNNETRELLKELADYTISRKR